MRETNVVCTKEQVFGKQASEEPGGVDDALESQEK
jgi:hypothetical protein